MKKDPGSNNNFASNTPNLLEEKELGFKPVVTYLSADLNKAEIIKENRNKAGVYRWVNLINTKTYIGSSTNLSERFLDYYQVRVLMKNQTPIHSALLKYGYSNFKLEILEYCKSEEAVSREQYYFDTLKPEYNILKIAGSSLGFRHSEETIARMKSLHLLDDEIRKNRVLARLGKTVSDESRAKISAAQTALIGIAVVVKNINTDEEIEYSNLTEAAKAIGVSRTAVKKALDLGKNIKGTYFIRKK
uniref:GIY-YIG endonuclease n=1 Tax=Scytalidium sp. TaxID=1715249 RepID=A0A513U0S2_9PEZI|nr:GIY-YIG endonuclease [Scytalidium sp.]